MPVAPRLRAAMGVAALMAVQLATGAARASPELSLDDPIHRELDELQLSGALPPFLGGVRPLGEARAQALRVAAGLPPDPRLVDGSARGPWVAPVRRLRLRGLLVRDHLRPYSTEVHPRDVAGGVAVSCEHQEGRTCGQGAGLEWELDAAAGWGPWVAAQARVRAVAGSDSYDPDAAVDRLSVSGELGPLSLLIGRAPLVVGPSPRTHAAWGDHAAALDQLRAQLAPIDLIGDDGDVMRGSAVFFLGRLRQPQRFDGSLVDGTRVQVDLWNRLELALTHLIVLGGDGAPEFSAVDYVLEHVRHKAGPPSQLGFASNRLAADVALTVPSARGLRVVYQIATEDLRDQIGTMLRRDADHVVSVQLDRVAPGVGVLVELTQTGVRSHEHQLFTTGTTNAGRIAGVPLGPSSTAAFVGVKARPWALELDPWLELVSQPGDIFAYGTGPIVRTEDLPDEHRLRGGIDAALAPATNLRGEVRMLAERVTTSDFVPGRTRWNAALELAVIWTPGWIQR